MPWALGLTPCAPPSTSCLPIFRIRASLTGSVLVESGLLLLDTWSHVPRMLQVLPETRKALRHKGMSLKWWNVRSEMFPCNHCLQVQPRLERWALSARC